MRSLADLQRAPGATVATGPAGLPIHVSKVRTFDTPEFAGMRFLEVETKSALNRVKGMGFAWSINPYRGCSHACSYCASGETPILMGDGRTKPLADLRIGDRVYGTIQAGNCRRYVITKVLDHWQTVKAAYRITLGDGTTLIASGDHRFLSDRGWKHVTGAEQGPLLRPHLTTGNRLIGTGRFEHPPKETDAYRRGYLCGMNRGDVEPEALERARAFRLQLGPSPRNDVIQPSAADDEHWAKGFLAGTFDAEGSFRQGVLRIKNTDPQVLATVGQALRRLAVPHAVEPAGAGGRQMVRIQGGLRQHLLFFHLVDPAIRSRCAIDGRAVGAPADLRIVSIEPLGFDLPLYDITTGTGDFVANGVISHNCFARPTHRYLNMSPGEDFEKSVVVKTNVVEVLRREVARRTWRGEHVAMGTNTDPYQRCEGRYALMPGIIDTLAQARTPFSILTKGTLISRDVDRLVAAAELVPVSAAFTVGMLDEKVWREAEPGTPSPTARLQVVRRLTDAGIPTGVMLAPIMPGINDDREQLEALVDAAARAGAAHITPIVLHLRPGVREIFWPWLQATHPELVGRYASLYRGTNAADAYRDAVGAFVAQCRTAAWRRHGRPPVPPHWLGSRDDRRPPAAQDTSDSTAGEPAQLTLL